MATFFITQTWQKDTQTTTWQQFLITAVWLNVAIGDKYSEFSQASWDKHAVHTSQCITRCSNSCFGLRSTDATTQDHRHRWQLNKTLLLSYKNTKIFIKYRNCEPERDIILLSLFSSNSDRFQQEAQLPQRNSTSSAHMKGARLFATFVLPLSHSAPSLPMFPLEFRAEVSCQETRVMGLSSSEDRMIVAGVVLAWYQCVTDRQNLSALCTASYAAVL